MWFAERMRRPIGFRGRVRGRSRAGLRLRCRIPFWAGCEFPACKASSPTAHIPRASTLTASASRFGRLGVHHVATSHRSRVLQLLQLPAAVALIICVVGGSDLASASPSDRRTGAKLVKAGLVIFLLIYTCLFLLVAASARALAALPPCEKRLLLALMAALPLLGLRILYSLLAYFSTISTFSATDGSVVVRAFMAVLEEMLIVVGYASVGILVPADRDAREGGVELGARGPKTGAGRPVQDVPRPGVPGGA